MCLALEKRFAGFPTYQNRAQGRLKYVLFTGNQLFCLRVSCLKFAVIPTLCQPTRNSSAHGIDPFEKEITGYCGNKHND